MITASSPSDRHGVAVLAATAGAAAHELGGASEVASLITRLLGEHALERTTLSEAPGPLDVAIELDGTEFVIRFHDFGEPITGPAPAVLGLVSAGLASAADGGTDGAGNLTVVRVPLPAHALLFDDAGVEVLSEDTPLTDAPVSIRPIDAGDAAALTRCIYRCYGWTYPATDLYYPERIAAAITSGRRIGEVAVDEQGEVAAHWGAVYVADGVVETGGTVTDPRFRRRGLVNELGERLLHRLVEAGVSGRIREPVLTHPATQHIALREGATMVGVLLNQSEPIQQIGITDGVQSHRPSLTQMYSPLRALEPATIWCPAAYEPIVRHVVGTSDWPREFGHAHTPTDCPPNSSLNSSYDTNRHVGTITVTTVGRDLIDSVDTVLEQLRHGGAEVVLVHLPANDPALASIGAGLFALSLSYASFLPSYGEIGDALTLQWLRDPVVDDADWHYADERVQQLAELVLGQARELSDTATLARRRSARRQQLFAALGDDD